MIEAVSSGRKKTDVAKDYGVSPSTLSTILKNKENILKTKDSGPCSQRKRLKCSPYEEVEKTLYTWFLDIRARNIPVSGATLQHKAKDIASLLGCDDFKASAGWLQKFKHRHNIVGKTLSGESRFVNQDDANDWITTQVSEILARFDAQDIYNADETGLFYQMLPNKTLDVKGDRCHGGK